MPNLLRSSGGDGISRFRVGLRDYLYIPLGGNRRGAARTYVNLALVMLLGGLWHGASWNFVIWGGIHGGMLALERRTRKGEFLQDSPETTTGHGDLPTCTDRLGFL